MLDFKRTSRELERNFADGVKSFHNLNLIGIWLGKVMGNWIGEKLAVNRECQLLRPVPYSPLHELLLYSFSSSKLFQQPHYFINRYRETDVLRILHHCQVYADEFSVEIQESATAIARIDRRICLQQS